MTGAVKRQTPLLLRRLDSDEPHIGPGDGLADGLSISGVVLLPPLVTRAPSTWAHGPADAAGLREALRAFQANDFTYFRRLSRKSSTVGVKVRPLSVTIATGKLEFGNLIGNCFRPLHSGFMRNIDLGIAVRKCPVVSK